MKFSNHFWFMIGVLYGGVCFTLGVILAILYPVAG